MCSVLSLRFELVLAALVLLLVFASSFFSTFWGWWHADATTTGDDATTGAVTDATAAAAICERVCLVLVVDVAASVGVCGTVARYLSECWWRCGCWCLC